jgi:hypothetical protein
MPRPYLTAVHPPVDTLHLPVYTCAADDHPARQKTRATAPDKIIPQSQGSVFFNFDPFFPILTLLWN